MSNQGYTGSGLPIPFRAKATGDWNTNHYFFDWIRVVLFSLVICWNNRLTSHQHGQVGERVLVGVCGRRWVSEWCHDIPAWLVCRRARHINEWAELACHPVIGAHTHHNSPFLMRSVVQEGFNLLLLSHRAWHLVERSLFRESIRSKIKLVPSAPSRLASRHKADDYQLAPAQQSTGASLPATNSVNLETLTSCRLPVLHLFL